MSITKQQSWFIFEAVSLGQQEGHAALAALIGEDNDSYLAHKEEFEMEIAKVGVEAQNEAAAINEDNPELIAELSSKPINRWLSEDYTKAASMFKGSKYEALHLSAMFRFSNNDLLLELVKPQP